MNTSYYFVLWGLAGLAVYSIDCPFVWEYGFIFMLVLGLPMILVCHKLLKPLVKLQREQMMLNFMEMIYSNEYKKFRRMARNRLINECFLLSYVLMIMLYTLIIPAEGALWVMSTVFAFVACVCCQDTRKAWRCFKRTKQEWGKLQACRTAFSHIT